MARSLPRSRHRGRSALSQSAVRDKSLPRAFCLSLPELPTGIPARAPHPPRDRVSRLLSKTQWRRLRSAVSTPAKRALLICHSDRSRGMERVERATWDRWAATVAAKSRETNEFNLLLISETSRDVSTSLDMTISRNRRYRSSFSPLAAFCPRSFAWINMSILPSITSCTLLVSAPVRWSFTI